METVHRVGGSDVGPSAGYGGASASLFPNRIQRTLSTFVFFIACPIASVFNISVTFFIFIVLLFHVHKYSGKIFRLENWYDISFVLFPAIGLISLIFAPSTAKSPGFFKDLQIWTQYVYWCALLLFVKVNGNKFEWQSLLRSVFWGLNIFILGFYFLSADIINTSVVSISFKFPRNAFVFQLLCMIPLCLYYVYKTKGKLITYFFCAVYFAAMLLSEGRAGSILCLFEIIAVVFLANKSAIHYMRYLILGFALIIVLNKGTVLGEDQKESLAEMIRPYNGRLADLIIGSGEGDLSRDKSWLIRLLMIKKAEEINKDFPWFGIGLNRFTSFNSQLPELRQRDFSRLRSSSIEFLNSRSAHNSYFQILAETGYIGLFVLLLILAIPTVIWVFRIFSSKINDRFLFAIPFFAIIVHFYAISSLTGAVSWFVIGLTYFSIKK